MRYEELVAMNRAAYKQRKKKERQIALIKFAVYAVVLTVCGTASIFVWNKYEAHKKQEAVLAAEEARRIEEAAHRKAEEQRLAAEEAARKRTEERLARERKLEEERLAREKQREEERLAWERKREEERLARGKERKEREEKLADARRRQEEERKASEQRELAAERKRQEQKRIKDAEARRLREEEESCTHVAVRRNTPTGKALQPSDKKNPADSKYQLEFFAARRDMGGSVLEALVRKLNNNIDDEDMSNTSPRNARAVAMSKISGTIGPIDYSRQIKTKKITSTQAIGGFDGYMDGGVVSGTVYGPVTSIKEKVGGYVANVPAGFKKGFEKLMTIARRGHSRANAEAGACIFVDATKGQIGMDERKALTLFTKAADLGDADGMFMEAFCLFYGIGRTSNSKKDIYEAYRILSIWQSLPGSQALSGSGWVQRRLNEAKQLGY